MTATESNAGDQMIPIENKIKPRVNTYEMDREFL